jgi:hypothetical protein
MALSLFASANKIKGVVRGEVDFFRLLKFLGLNQGVLYILYFIWVLGQILNPQMKNNLLKNYY